MVASTRPNASNTLVVRLPSSVDGRHGAALGIKHARRSIPPRIDAGLDAPMIVIHRRHAVARNINGRLNLALAVENGRATVAQNIDAGMLPPEGVVDRGREVAQEVLRRRLVTAEAVIDVAGAVAELIGRSRSPRRRSYEHRGAALAMDVDGRFLPSLAVEDHARAVAQNVDRRASSWQKLS